MMFKVRKQVYKYLTGIAAAITMAASHAHASTSNAVGTASITIAKQITVVQKKDLNFGVVRIGSEADEISIGFDGNVTSSNGSKSVGGAPSTAEFEVVGEADSSYTVTIVETDLTGDGGVIPLKNLRHNAGDTPAFGPDGQATFNIAGTVKTSAGLQPGIYSGSYSVSVNYQ